MSKEQRIILFSGTVQGVGFRYTTCRVADSYDISGTVRNMPDGRVECVVEGESAEIDAFMAELTATMNRYIRKQTQNHAPFSGRFASFSVTF